MTDTTAIPDSAGIDPAVGSAMPDTSTSLPPLSPPKAPRAAAFTLERRTLKLNGIPTSIALEPAFWSYYDKVAKDAGVGWPVLVACVLDRPHAKGAQRPSVLRVAAFYAVIRSASSKAKPAL